MFGKKNNAEDLIKLFSALSDEEKQKFLTGIGESKGEPPKEETATPHADVAPTEGTEEVTEPTEEAPAEPTAEPAEVADDGNTDGQPEEAQPNEGQEDEQPAAPNEPPMAEPQQGEQSNEDAVAGQTHENLAEIVQGFGQRLSALEAEIQGFAALKERMEDYTRKQEAQFGYKPGVDSTSEDIQSMSADELRKKILNGEK